MRRARHITWAIILLLGLAEGAGLIHTTIHAHAISPVTGTVFHPGAGHDHSPDSCPGPADPAPADECQVFAVFSLSATTAPLPIPTAAPDLAPDFSPWRVPDLTPVARPFALWLLAPSLSPPAPRA